MGNLGFSSSVASTWEPSLLGAVKNQQPPALLKLQKQTMFPEVGSPLLGNSNSVELQAIFMASVGYPPVGSPPIGRTLCR